MSARLNPFSASPAGIKAALGLQTYVNACGLDAEGHKAPYPLGHFFLAIDVSEFIEPARFRALAGGILRELRASPKAPGAEAIFTPGEKEHLVREYRRVHGCPVSPALRRDLETLRAWYGLPHRFPWD